MRSPSARQAAAAVPRPQTNICLIRPAVRLDICPMTEASRAPHDRPGASARPAGARSGRGRRVPRKEHVTLRRLTLGSRKYFRSWRRPACLWRRSPASVSRTSPPGLSATSACPLPGPIPAMTAATTPAATPAMTTGGRRAPGSPTTRRKAPSSRSRWPSCSRQSSRPMRSDPGQDALAADRPNERRRSGSRPRR
jgi:hypothetical protein